MIWPFTLLIRSSPRSQAEEIAELVVQKSNEKMTQFQIEVNNRFKEVQAQLNQLDTNISLIDKKLSVKELKDRQDYGQMKYRISQLDSL